MPDIVTRLRNWRVVYAEEENDHPDEGTLYIKAADRIEQLEAERDAAYKRGLEDAAKIAEMWLSKDMYEAMTPGADLRNTVARQIAAAIRTKIGERE